MLAVIPALWHNYSTLAAYLNKQWKDIDMKYNDFFKLINTGTLTGAYLLHGSEEYVKDSALKQIIDRFEPSTRSMNVADIHEFDVEALIDLCETMPFFSDSRLVVCRRLPDGDGAARIIEYIGEMPSTTLLIFFIRGKCDTGGAKPRAKSSSSKKSASSGQFVLDLEAMGRCVEFTGLSNQDLLKWVKKTAAELNSSIEPNVSQRLINLAGTDLSVINNELMKAADYVERGNPITAEAIESCVSPNIEYRVFDMADYFSSGHPADGFKALDRIIKDGEDPLGIARYLESRYKVMLQAKLMIEGGINRSDAIRRIGGSAYATGKAFDAAKRYPLPAIFKAAKAFSDIFYMNVTGTAGAREALEAALAAAAI